MPTFDVLRILIKLFKDEELDYETFCDAVGEFSSDPNEKYKLVLGLVKYTENIEFYNFADIKLMTDDERTRLAIGITNFMQEYLREHGLSEEWDENLDEEKFPYED